jgi:Zn-dependent protease
MEREDRRSFRDPIRRRRGSWRLLGGTVPLLSIGGVRIGIHPALLLTVAAILLLGPTRNVRWQGRLDCSAAFILAAFFHEIAQRFARRIAVNDVDDAIVISPVGGSTALASRRRTPSLMAVAAGPLAHLLLCLFAGAGLALFHGAAINPLRVIATRPFTTWHDPVFHLGWIYAVNATLLIINLLPIFPLDGGVALQWVLVRGQGFDRGASSLCIIGLIGSAILAVTGLVTQVWLVLFLVADCVFFLTVMALRWAEQTASGESIDPLEDAFADTLLDPRSAAAASVPIRRRRLSRLAIRRLRRLAREEELDQIRLDAILAKVSARGLHSLTWIDRRVLRKATDRQRHGEEKEVG